MPRSFPNNPIIQISKEAYAGANISKTQIKPDKLAMTHIQNRHSNLKSNTSKTENKTGMKSLQTQIQRLRTKPRN